MTYVKPTAGAITSGYDMNENFKYVRQNHLMPLDSDFLVVEDAYNLGSVTHPWNLLFATTQPTIYRSIIIPTGGAMQVGTTKVGFNMTNGEFICKTSFAFSVSVDTNVITSSAWNFGSRWVGELNLTASVYFPQVSMDKIRTVHASVANSAGDRMQFGVLDDNGWIGATTTNLSFPVGVHWTGRTSGAAGYTANSYITINLAGRLADVDTFTAGSIFSGRVTITYTI